MYYAGGPTMIQSNGHWVVEEDEIIYGEYGEMVDKKIVKRDFKKE